MTIPCYQPPPKVKKSFLKVAKMRLVYISFDETTRTSAGVVSTQDSNKLMLDVKAKFYAADLHCDRVQILTRKSTSWTIEKTAELFQRKLYTVQHTLTLKTEQGVLVFC